ncbi:hypothetical protein ACFLY8_03220 [Halobacteriota archaeon]
MGEETQIPPDLVNRIFLKVFPQLVVNSGLYDNFIKNPVKATEKLQSILHKSEKEGNLTAFIESDFLSDRKELLAYITKNQVRSPNIDIMFLLRAVSIFEDMINQHLQNELDINYPFNVKKINDVILYRLSIEDKLGWFLKIISGKDFTKSKKWGFIKSNYKARNFFIHYKTEKEEKLDNYLKYLEISNIKKFLDYSRYCYNYLKKARSEKLKRHDKMVNTVRTIMEEMDRADRAEKKHLKN